MPHLPSGLPGPDRLDRALDSARDKAADTADRVTDSVADRVTDLGGYLRHQRQTAELSLRQLAEAAGVSNPYLSQVERGLRQPSASVLTQIARGLSISAEALYVRAGLLDEAPTSDVEQAVRRDPDLSERQRQVLLDVYASFRTENARGTVTPSPVKEALVDTAPAKKAPVKKAPAKKTTRKKATRKRATTPTAAGPSAARRPQE